MCSLSRRCTLTVVHKANVKNPCKFQVAVCYSVLSGCVVIPLECQIQLNELLHECIFVFQTPPLLKTMETDECIKCCWNNNKHDRQCNNLWSVCGLKQSQQVRRTESCLFALSVFQAFSKQRVFKFFFCRLTPWRVVFSIAFIIDNV